MVKFISSLLVLAGYASAQSDADFDEDSWEAFWIQRQGLRDSSVQFSGWITGIEHDGIQLVAHGANTGTFDELLPGDDLGCNIYQPDMRWGHSDYVAICNLINDAAGIQTGCEEFDDDDDGGLCPNTADANMILTYEHWGATQSTGPDIWASDSTFVRDHSPDHCNRFRKADGCVFPTHGSNSDDCKAVSHTWSVIVYACDGFSRQLKAFDGPQDLLAECTTSNTDSSSLYGCWCAALGDDADPLKGKPVDDIDVACNEYSRCMRCNACNSKSLQAVVDSDCINIDCNGDACCQCAADYVAAVDGLSMTSANFNLDRSSCVQRFPSTRNC